MFSVCFVARGQSTYLQPGTEDYHLLDRLETRLGGLSDTLFSSFKPVSRRDAVRFLVRQRDSASGLSAIDQYNLSHMISVSGEWLPEGDGAIPSRKPWLKRYYKTQSDLFRVRTDDFFLVVNPVISGQLMYDRNSKKSQRRFSSSRGAEFRGWIHEKVGFYAFVTDNQEQVPDFVDSWIRAYNAVPGADFYSRKSNHYDYMQARGYVDVGAVKDHLHFTFGYDKHFFGDGQRSLFLSDFAGGAPFLQINSRLGRFNYQNLYLELTPQFRRNNGRDTRRPTKYATIHSLSFNATRWLNLSLFESTVFSKRDEFNPGYLMPVILYRTVAQGLSDADNVNVGLSFKAIALRRLQFYGQFLLDDIGSGAFSAKSSWRNRFGLQLGAKYFDVGGIRNLDLQAEMNMVRPYTYSSDDSVANYTHYHQPLAHPLGAGFRELTGIVRYQPFPKLYVSLRGIYYNQGMDSSAASYGANLFKRTSMRPMDENIGLIHGVKVTSVTLEANISYELRENLFVDLGAGRRAYSAADKIIPNHTTYYGYGGVRLNIARRDYNFY